MTKTEWENWRRLCKSLLDSSLFRDYQEAKKCFFESDEYREYVKAEERVDSRPVRGYLEYGAEPEEEMHGTPEFLKWFFEQYRDLDREWEDDDFYPEREIVDEKEETDSD